MSSADRVGHIANVLLAGGMLALALDQELVGWGVRLAGELIWVWIGLRVGLSSIWTWGVLFALIHAGGALRLLVH